MKFINLDKVKKSLDKYQGVEYSHCFIIDRPSWDEQNIYYDIYYNVESEIFHDGVIVANLITDEELETYAMMLGSNFNLPVKKWKRILVDYCV